MRVTQQQQFQPLLIGARDSAAKVQEIRAKISSGKKVNTTSDDPLASRRIMRFQDKINNIEQFLVNVRDGSAILKTETAFLEDVNENLLRARELINQASNEFLTQTERDAIAEEINGILESVLQDSNGKNIDNFIFAGSKTDTKPFESTIVNGEISAVTYKGDLKTAEYQINEGINFRVNESGQKIFIDSDAGSSTKAISLGGNLDTGMAVSGTAKDSVTVFDSDGRLHTLNLTFTKNTNDEYSVAVSSNETGVTFSDAALGSIAFNSLTGSFTAHTDATSGINVNFGLGSQAINFDFSKMSQIAQGVKISLDSKDGKNGGYGVFDILIKVRDTLKNKNGLSENGQVKELTGLLSAVDKVSDRLFKKISEFGSKINSLESAENRLEDLKIRIDGLRSADEDADIIELVSELTSQEAVFQATLSSGARISRVSLLNFI